MIEQKGKTVRFEAFYSESKLGKTGLTVTINVYNPAGTKIINGGSASEIGDGLYKYDLSSASTTTAGTYSAVFKTATTTVDQRDIPAAYYVGSTWVEYIDQAISTAATTIKFINKAGQKILGISGS